MFIQIEKNNNKLDVMLRILFFREKETKLKIKEDNLTLQIMKNFETKLIVLLI